MPAWTPILEQPSPLASQSIRINWNGYTSTSSLDLLREAQLYESNDDYESAEASYKKALAVFERLLPVNHPDVRTAVYGLANLCAQRGRTKDADRALDWLTEKYMSNFGSRHRLTAEHVLRVSEMLDGWGRPIDALELLSKAKQCFSSQNNAGEGASRCLDSDTSDNGTTVRFPHAEHAAATDLSNLTLDLSTAEHIDQQLNATSIHVEGTDMSILPVISAIVDHCNSNPCEHGARGLRARADVVRLYYRAGDAINARSSLFSADSAFQGLWTLKNKFGKHDAVSSSLQILEQCIIAGEYQLADEWSNLMQDRINDKLGPDHKGAILLLFYVGIMFQKQKCWNYAKPRFEQALAAALSSDAPEVHLLRSLEDALDAGQYFGLGTKYEGLAAKTSLCFMEEMIEAADPDGLVL